MTKQLRRFLVGLFIAIVAANLGTNFYFDFSQLLYTGDPGWFQREDGRLDTPRGDYGNPSRGVVRDGDEIVALNQQPVDKGRKLFVKTFKYAPPGTLYTITVRRDGVLHDFTLRTAPLPLITWFGTAQGYLIFVVFFLTGLILFALRPDDKQVIVLVLLLVAEANSPSPPRGFIETAWPLYVVLLISRSLVTFIAALFLHLFLIFPERSKILRRFPSLEWSPYVFWLVTGFPAAVINAYKRLTAPQDIFYNITKEFPRLISINRYAMLIIFLCGIAALVVNYLQSSALSKRRTRVVLAGTIFGVALPIAVATAMSYTRDDVRYGTPGIIVSFFTSSLFLLLPLSFVYAIARHQVIPISLIVRRSARYLFVSRGSIVLEVLAVGLALAFLMNEFFRYHAWSGRTVGIISAVVAIIVWQLTAAFNKRFIAPVIDRRFFREAYNAQAILADLMRAMRSLTDTRQLLELVVSRIQAALHAQNVNVFLQPDSSGDYVRALSSEYMEGTHRSTVPTNEKDFLAGDGFVAHTLRDTGAPLTTDFTDPNSWLNNHAPPQQLDDVAAGSATATTKRGDVETLRRIDSALLLPLSTKNELIGFVSLGARLGDLPYSANDEQLLMSVAGQITLALENARLVEGMLEEGRRRQEVEAENARRAKEMEEARGLQLSMLPKTVPQLPNLEIAAYMKPATEVGGDYYDFHVGDDGTLTVAVGDATGHGLKAGTMVTATKGLFNAFAGNADIPQIFKETSRALKKMNLRGLYMGMTMLKITDRHLVVSAAGMPSTLIYRAATHEIEEVAIRAMPLGSVSNFAYQQQEHALSVGDAVLMMSDGFPEMFNEQGEMLDYAKAKTLLKEIAQSSPQEIINRFVEVGEAWAGTRAPDDDVTFVVLKVKDTNGHLAHN